MFRTKLELRKKNITQNAEPTNPHERVSKNEQKGKKRKQHPELVNAVITELKPVSKAYEANSPNQEKGKGQVLRKREGRKLFT
ncbi:unnamed protein product [Hymenolepis diminuta]|uniref:Uncharacterized protein n=1 Tax=Hymenolepis diminuta TaxID=6216 RepID=A0A564ZBX9_HYMDI|nr:unnamed protein product [Hymenolepis diminuta]